jgi:hypothetical protein
MCEGGGGGALCCGGGRAFQGGGRVDDPSIFNLLTVPSATPAGCVVDCVVCMLRVVLHQWCLRSPRTYPGPKPRTEFACGLLCRCGCG